MSAALAIKTLTRGHSAKFGDVFALRVGGTTFDVVTSPTIMKDLLNNPKHPIDMDSLTWHMMKHFFGDDGAWQKVGTNPMTVDMLWGTAHKTLSQMMREPFLSRATDSLLRSVEGKVWNLLSGNVSWVDQERWERVAQTEVLSGHHGSDFVAEADLHVLLRDWVGYIASPLIMGQSFMDNNPNILDDLWLFDSKVNMFMLGLPHWLVPGLTPAAAARERALAAVQEWHDAMFKIIDGQDPGSKYDDMSDVPQFLWDRLKAMRDITKLVDTDADRADASGNLSIFWAMNVNANQVIFWMIFYIFSDPELVQQLRHEIRPFVQLKKTPTALPIAESPTLSIDHQGLLNKCPLLRATFFETMRLESAPTSFKTVKDDFTVTAPVHSARLQDKRLTETYSMQKGHLICMPMAVHHKDPDYWSQPDTFVPQRFWTETVDEQGAKSIKVDYKTMQIWGGGRTMCKGRHFAEREVLIFSAAILMCWDFDIANTKDADPRTGRWTHPGRVTTAGTNAPKKDVRVRISRRKEPWS